MWAHYIIFLVHPMCRKMEQGINRFRHILKAVETRTSQNIRTTLARELAEVLLRGVCEHRYTPPSVDGREERTGSLSRSSVSGGSASSLRPASSRGSLKPKLYTMERLDNTFFLQYSNAFTKIISPLRFQYMGLLKTISWLYWWINDLIIEIVFKNTLGHYALPSVDGLGREDR